jgi:ABC-2 type transport system permease protein
LRKLLLVIRHEVITTLRRRSFLFTTFGIPLISALILVGFSLLNRNSPEAVSTIFGPASPAAGASEGYVDESGLIRSLPPSLPQGALKAYPDETEAKAAITAGAIRAYYVIPQDYLQSGEVIYVRPDFNPLSAFEQADRIKEVLQYNLLGGDASLVAKIDQPVRTQVKLLEPDQARDQNNPLAFFLPYAVTMMYYFVILMSSNLLLNSITKEKENRVVEILLSTITPRQLLSGKIVGLGLAGLLQTVVWIGTGYSLLRLSGRSFNLPPDFQLPPSILFWGLIFFLLGYGVYASLMASVGALVPNLREASQATIVVVLPMIIPLMLISILIQDPNGALAIGLSLFPLTAPVAMMTRLAAGTVPAWQVALSALILLVTAVLIMRAVARMFRAQTLLTGQPFELRRLIAALAGRA